MLVEGNSHTQGGRDAVGGMSAGKGVVLALQGRWEGSYATELAVGAELMASSGEYFVAVGLMSHVPNQFVVWRVEDIVERHGEFYHTE